MAYKYESMDTSDNVSMSAMNNEDKAELKVSLWSPEPMEPRRFKRDITRTLQTWANKNAIRGEFEATEISDDGRTAIITVRPAAVLCDLLTLSGKVLITKDQKKFSIKMHQNEPSKVDEKSSVGHASSLNLTNAQNWQLVDMNKNDSSADDGKGNPLIVAWGPYWYMKSNYPDHIQRIERENGVKITENVQVTISADKKHSDPNKAYNEFIKLVQSCLSESCGVGAKAKKVEKEEPCPVCMDTFKEKTVLKCKHEFCKDCLDRSVKSLGATCPVCKDVFGLVEGDQPDGTMTWNTSTSPLPGFHGCGSIIITYNIPSGIQTKKHPNPGRAYHGLNRTAYLPGSREGNEVLKLLKRAFDQRLIFTVGTSRTTGQDNVVTWNDIPHKTSIHGGQQGFGYPDPDYLSRVKDELKAKGIK